MLLIDKFKKTGILPVFFRLNHFYLIFMTIYYSEQFKTHSTEFKLHYTYLVYKNYFIMMCVICIKAFIFAYYKVLSLFRKIYYKISKKILDMDFSWC